MEDSVSIFSFELSVSLLLEVFRLLEGCVIQYFPCDDEYSAPLGPAKKQRKPSLLKSLLLEACRKIPAHVEEMHALSELHVNFA